VVAQRGGIHHVVDERQQARAAGADDVHLAAHLVRQLAAGARQQALADACGAREHRGEGFA